MPEVHVTNLNVTKVLEDHVNYFFKFETNLKETIIDLIGRVNKLQKQVVELNKIAVLDQAILKKLKDEKEDK